MGSPEISSKDVGISRRQKAKEARQKAGLVAGLYLLPMGSHPIEDLAEALYREFLDNRGQRTKAFLLPSAFCAH